MNSDSQIVIFKPLTEIVDFHGRRYYTENTVEELEDLMDNNDRIFFPFSNRGVRVAQIVDYGPADSETVTSEWTIRELTDSQRRIFEASKKGFLEFWG